jgi:hypothetical protein
MLFRGRDIHEGDPKRIQKIVRGKEDEEALLKGIWRGAFVAKGLYVGTSRFGSISVLQFNCRALRLSAPLPPFEF